MEVREEKTTPSRALETSPGLCPTTSSYYHVDISNDEDVCYMCQRFPLLTLREFLRTQLTFVDWGECNSGHWVYSSSFVFIRGKKNFLMRNNFFALTAKREE